MHLDARTSSIECATNYEYRFEFLQVLKVEQTTVILRHEI